MPQAAFRSATVKSGYDAGEHFVAFDSDFGCGELRGTFEYKTLAQSFVNFIGDKLPTMPGLPKMRKAADNDLQFVLLTGVTKFSQVSVFSGFNQPLDISMDKRYEALCGITQEELENYFAEMGRRSVRHGG